ncbi:hypothetical protein WG219_16870 [Ectopseudomonas mendocina]|uniref:Uncharacterized protein n=1 Tax=Ectopseudomonas mendocina TaxID=300 RepID=A0ABZ2RJS1_ECTME
MRLLRGFVKGNLNVLTGSNEQRMLVRNWLEQGLSLEEAQLSTSQQRQLLNLLYVGMGEYLGPEEADWRLSRAVKQSESAALVLAPNWLM